MPRGVHRPATVSRHSVGLNNGSNAGSNKRGGSASTVPGRASGDGQNVPIGHGRFSFGLIGGEPGAGVGPGVLDVESGLVPSSALVPELPGMLGAVGVVGTVGGDAGALDGDVGFVDVAVDPLPVSCAKATPAVSTSAIAELNSSREHETMVQLPAYRCTRTVNAWHSLRLRPAREVSERNLRRRA